jgi:modulator of FtsH protease
MSDAYDPTAWHDFAAGLASASAALTGLVFVAVSIHLQAVLGDSVHQRRAESTFVSLLVVLGAALLLLLPGLTANVYGAASIAIAALMFLRAIRSASVLKVGQVGHEPWFTWWAAMLSYGCLLVGGVGLLTRSTGGLYVVAAALVLIAARAMIIVWVLFVSLGREEAGDGLQPEHMSRERQPAHSLDRGEARPPNPAREHQHGSH